MKLFNMTNAFHYSSLLITTHRDIYDQSIVVDFLNIHGEKEKRAQAWILSALSLPKIVPDERKREVSPRYSKLSVPVIGEKTAARESMTPPGPVTFDPKTASVEIGR
jgi:hypothetical protein